MGAYFCLWYLVLDQLKQTVMGKSHISIKIRTNKNNKHVFSSFFVGFFSSSTPMSLYYVGDWGKESKSLVVIVYVIVLLND